MLFLSGSPHGPLQHWESIALPRMTPLIHLQSGSLMTPLDWWESIALPRVTLLIFLPSGGPGGPA